MLMYKICLTGGPGAGKTTVLNSLKDELEVLGFRVFVIDEVATRLIKLGIKPFGEGKIDITSFEEKVIDSQINEEIYYELALNNIWREPCILICDRGLLDPKAYMNPLEYQKLLDIRNIKEENIINNYDLVIHMKTAAFNKGYTKENNKARSEDEKEAIIKDNNTLDAWKNHNNLKVIKSYDNFEEKITEVKKVVLSEVLNNMSHINDKNSVLVKRQKNAV